MNEIKRGIMRYIFLIISLVLIVQPASAFYDALYLGVRSNGMGGAQAAVGGDLAASLSNPALLMELTNITMTAFYGMDYQGLDIGEVGSYWVGIGIPLTKFAVSASWYNRHTSIESANLLNENMLHLSVASQILQDINLGLGLRSYSTSWLGDGPADFSEQADAFDIDFGALLELQEGFYMGIAAQNLMASNLGYASEQPLPRTFKIGISYLMNKYHDDLLAFDLNFHDEDFTVHGGYETWRNKDKSVGLRLGFIGGNNDNLAATAGLTVKYFPIQIDYSFGIPFGSVNTRIGQHFFALSYKHGLPPPIDYEEPPKKYKTPIQKIKPKQDISHSANLAIPQAALSPNGDGYMDQLTVTSIVEFNQNVDGWSVSIYDRKNNIVKQMSGSGPVPTSLTWDGRDNFGRTMIDGTYYMNLEAYYSDGFKAISEMNEIQILSKVGSIGVTVSPEYLVLGEFEGFTFPSLIEFNFSGDTKTVNNWTLTIQNKLSGTKVKEYSESGPLPENLVWDGKSDKEIKQGEYTINLAIQDNVGNHGPVNNDVVIYVINSLKQTSVGLELVHDPIEFDDATQRIYNTSLLTLDKIGQTMAFLSDYAFMIDAYSNTEDNALAFANAICDYLNRNFQIERARLFPLGKQASSQTVRIRLSNR
jgi:gliding motility-associated-like protein